MTVDDLRIHSQELFTVLHTVSLSSNRIRSMFKQQLYEPRFAYENKTTEIELITPGAQYRIEKWAV